ncbi:hypothetical protein BASA61_006936 [Batrachochytrium salamandrivorans]|nr:hypothetical protein BASA60_005466 [Batrachochytrium salamandrivorans]KAH6585294.1 hypothetical protein BASA61_006936 [Batrachochytrium salamandrivorans]
MSHDGNRRTSFPTVNSTDHRTSEYTSELGIPLYVDPTTALDVQLPSAAVQNKRYDAPVQLDTGQSLAKSVAPLQIPSSTEDLLPKKDLDRPQNRPVSSIHSIPSDLLSHDRVISSGSDSHPPINTPHAQCHSQHAHPSSQIPSLINDEYDIGSAATPVASAQHQIQAPTRKLPHITPVDTSCAPKVVNKDGSGTDASSALTDMPLPDTEVTSPVLITLLSPTKEPINDALLRLDLGAFWQWVLCFCIVNFDLEIGQALEMVYPPIEFTENEKRTIACSAFPDSNSSEHLGDSCFTFRMRNSDFCNRLYVKRQIPNLPLGSQLPVSGSSSTSSLPTMLATHSQQADPLVTPSADSQQSTQHTVGLPVDTDGYTYGYVLFRQQADSEVRRGFLQKSLVLLSPYPWPGLFLHIVSLLGPELMSSLVADRRSNAQTHDSENLESSSEFESTASTTGILTPTTRSAVTPAFQGMAMLEAACFNIAAWPPPPSSLSPERSYCSIVLQIPFLGGAQRFSFPPTARFPQLHELPRPGMPQVITAGTIDSQPMLCTPGHFSQLFERSVDSLWMCWELMVLAEPIMVMGDTPKACSKMVWTLVELIKPIPFGGDFRPYFTIQDADFKRLTNRTMPPPQGTVLGVTNRMFQNALEFWPHTIRVARPQPVTPIKPFGGASLSNMNNRGTGSTNKRRLDASIESMTVKHRPFLSKDKRLLKELIDATSNGQSTEALDNIIRRHFMELTDRFLQPLSRYFESMIVGNPSHMSLSCLRSRPDIKPFQQDTFLRQIEQSIPILPVTAKRPIPELYRQFLKSPNFATWLQHRTAEVGREWQHQYFNVLCFSDVASWAKGRLNAHADVECIDLLLRLRNEVKKYAPFFVVEDDRVNYAHLARASSNSVASAAVALSAPMPSDNKDTRRPNSTGVVLSHAASSGPLLNRPEQHERPVKNYDPNFGIDITSLHVSASASSYHTDRRGMRAGATAGKSASDISRPRTPPPHQTYGHGPLSNSQTTVKTSGVPHTRHQSDQTHLNGRVGINSLGNPYSHNTLSSNACNVATETASAMGRDNRLFSSFSGGATTRPPTHKAANIDPLGVAPNPPLASIRTMSSPIYSTVESGRYFSPVMSVESCSAALGGCIPSPEHYARMHKQLDILLNTLPSDLCVSFFPVSDASN